MRHNPLLFVEHFPPLSGQHFHSMSFSIIALTVQIAMHHEYGACDQHVLRYTIANVYCFSLILFFFISTRESVPIQFPIYSTHIAHTHKHLHQTAINKTSSRLKIRQAVPSDTGNYTCVPTIAQAASVYAHVISGK